MEIWQAELARVEGDLYTMIRASMVSTTEALEDIEKCLDALNETSDRLIRQVIDINKRIDKLERKLNEREIVQNRA